MDAMEALVVHVPERHRYELRLDGTVAGHLVYVETDGVLALTHTVIEPELRNRGHAERLVAAALADIRSRGGRIRPVCPYIGTYLRRHPEDADLVA